MSEYYGFTKYTDLGEIKHVETSIVNGYLIYVAWYSYPYIDNKEFHFENVFDFSCHQSALEFNHANLYLVPILELTKSPVLLDGVIISKLNQWKWFQV